MNILYINHYAGSPEMGMEFRPYYLSREWVKMGHKVTVIAGDYSHLRKNNPKVSRDLQKETIDGIDYYWLKTGSYDGNGVKRALTMIRFCTKLYKLEEWINRKIKPDVIISSSTYPIDAIPVHHIAKKSSKKVKHIHEVHDMWPSTLTEIGGMSKWNPFVMLMQFGENYAYKNADAVVSLPQYAKEYMIKHGLKKDKFCYIPNGIVKEEWENALKLPEEHTAELDKIKDKFVVGYFGGHALSNCLQTLLETADQMKDDAVHFVLVGDGVEKKSLIQYAKDKGLNNVTFLPSIDKRAIPTLIEYFDCTYVGAKDSPLYRFGVCMNKMFDGMMAGKPIIFAINAPTTPVQEAECGIVVPPENPDAISQAINNIIKMSDDERNQMGNNGRETMIKKYTYEKLASQFVELFG